MHRLQEYKNEARRILKDAVLITPTCAGTFTRDQVRMDPIATNSLMGLYTNHCNLLDMCAFAVPTETACKKDPFGITVFSVSGAEGLALGTADAFLKRESMTVAVCGLHKKGYPLEHQLTELGAVYVASAATKDCYRLYRLNAESAAMAKPGMVREETGASIEVDLYRIPVAQFGKFMRRISEPLSMGTVTLDTGDKVTGFLCESYAAEDAVDITSQKSFRL